MNNKCPECGKFLQIGSVRKFARKPGPSGRVVLIYLSCESCTCGYRKLENYEKAIARMDLKPYR